MKQTGTLSRLAEADAQTIVYNPIAWLHPERFSLPAGFSSPMCRRVLNDLVLAHFALSVGELDLDNEAERYLTHHWRLIPKAAFMVVCQRYKASLFRDGGWWRLDDCTRQFAMLTLVEKQEISEQPVTLSQLHRMAVQEVAVLSHSVSLIMKQRLPLLFPHDDVVPASPCACSESNALIMRMAIQHAKRNQ